MIWWRLVWSKVAVDVPDVNVEWRSVEVETAILGEIYRHKRGVICRPKGKLLFWSTKFLMHHQMHEYMYKVPFIPPIPRIGAETLVYVCQHHSLFRRINWLSSRKSSSVSFLVSLVGIEYEGLKGVPKILHSLSLCQNTSRHKASHGANNLFTSHIEQTNSFTYSTNLVTFSTYGMFYLHHLISVLYCLILVCFCW